MLFWCTTLNAYRVARWLSQVTPKPTRSLRGTRRIVSEDSADDLPRPAATTGASARKSKDTRASDTPGSKPTPTAVPRRVINRERVQCYHLQVRGPVGLCG